MIRTFGGIIIVSTIPGSGSAYLEVRKFCNIVSLIAYLQVRKFGDMSIVSSIPQSGSVYLDSLETEWDKLNGNNLPDPVGFNRNSL